MLRNHILGMETGLLDNSAITNTPHRPSCQGIRRTVTAKFPMLASSTLLPPGMACMDQRNFGIPQDRYACPRCTDLHEVCRHGPRQCVFVTNGLVSEYPYMGPPHIRTHLPPHRAKHLLGQPLSPSCQKQGPFRLPRARHVPSTRRLPPWAIGACSQQPWRRRHTRSTEKREDSSAGIHPGPIREDFLVHLSYPALLLSRRSTERCRPSRPCSTATFMPSRRAAADPVFGSAPHPSVTDLDARRAPRGRRSRG